MKVMKPEWSAGDHQIPESTIITCGKILHVLKEETTYLLELLNSAIPVIRSLKHFNLLVSMESFIWARIGVMVNISSWKTMYGDNISTSAQIGFNSRHWLHCYIKFMFSMTKIESLNCTIRKDINFVFFRKFVTVLAQKNYENGNKLTCSQYLDWQFSSTTCK